MPANTTLPPIDKPQPDNVIPNFPGNPGTLVPPVAIDVGGSEVTTSKDISIGVGVLLVLALVFVFIRNGYVNWLVSSRKRAPNSAGLAGWGLFGTLFFAAAIGCIGIISKSLFTLPFIVPLALLSMACLFICILSSRQG